MSMMADKHTEPQSASAESEADGTTDGTAIIKESNDAFTHHLSRLIRIAVRILAIVMVVVIFFGVADVLYVLYQRILSPPVGLLEINDILATFGAFMAVLIAIEIFHNIVLYLKSDIVHIRIVLATALMAIARKVIVLDFNETAPAYVYGTAAVVATLGVVYWLVVMKSGEPQAEGHRAE